MRTIQERDIYSSCHCYLNLRTVLIWSEFSSCPFFAAITWERNIIHFTIIVDCQWWFQKCVMKDGEWFAISWMFPRSTELTCTWVTQAGFPTSRSLPAERPGALLLLGTRLPKPGEQALLECIYPGFAIASLSLISSCEICLVTYACSPPASINWIYFCFIWQQSTHCYKNLRITLVRFNLHSACLHDMTEVRRARHLAKPWGKLRKCSTQV